MFWPENDWNSNPNSYLLSDFVSFFPGGLPRNSLKSLFLWLARGLLVLFWFDCFVALLSLCVSSRFNKHYTTPLPHSGRPRSSILWSWKTPKSWTEVCHGNGHKNGKKNCMQLNSFFSPFFCDFSALFCALNEKHLFRATFPTFFALFSKQLLAEMRAQEGQLSRTCFPQATESR